MQQELWTKIKGLQGQTLSTVTGKEFDVVDVTADTVTVVPRSTGKPRPIRAAEIEAAAELPGGQAELTSTQVREAGASEVNPVYVVAILKAVSG